MTKVLARVGGMLATIALASAMLLAPMFVRHVSSVQLSAVNAASVTSCTTTHTDRTSHAASGSWSHTITDKRTCGKSYSERIWRFAQSYTGAHSTTNETKTGTTKPAHYVEQLHRVSVSKTGKVTITDETIVK